MIKEAILAAAFFSGGLAAPLQAQTLSYADAITQLSQACGRDIQTYCKGLNLGNGRIYDCLQHQSTISATCNTSLAKVLQSLATRERAQAAYQKQCSRDIARRCSGIKGDGFVLICLLKKEQRVSEGCNQAITDAGWR